MASRSQIARALHLANALARSGRGVVLRTLAEQKGWPVRALYRDIKSLEEAGFPIRHAAGRYALVPGWLPPAQASPAGDELTALFVARQLSRGVATTTFGRALDRLWTKLGTPAHGQASLVAPDGVPPISVRVPGSIDYREHAKTVALLERAIATRVVVSARYRALSGGGQVTARVLEPGELHWDPGLESLYLIAWCRLRGAPRVFAVHRFLACSLGDEGFAPRPETRSRTALRHAFRVWRDENVTRVRARFWPPAAEEIRERRWHGSQRLEEAGGGAVVIEMDVAGTAEVERWVLGYGDAAEVLAPGDLRRQVAGRLRAGAGRYGGAGEEDSVSLGDIGGE